MIDRLDVRAIVFDAVGTLMYAAPPVADVYARVGKSHGSTLSVEEVRARFARAFREHYCNKVSTVVDEQLERKCWQCVVDDVFAGQGIDRVAVLNDLWGYFGRPDSWAMYDDAVCAWRQLMDMDVVLGIASDFDDRLLSVCDGIPDLRDCRHIYSSAAVGGVFFLLSLIVCVTFFDVSRLF